MDDNNFWCLQNGTSDIQTCYIKKIYLKILYYGGPVMMLLGTVGNLSAAYVVVKSKALWKNTISLYILVLAIVDTLALNSLLVSLIIYEYTSQSVYEAYTWYYHLSFILPVYESWILVCISVERLIAVYWPFQYISWCTKKRAGLGLALTFLVTLIPFTLDILHMEIYTVFDDWHLGWFIFDILRFVLAALLPFVVLVITSAATLWKVVQTSRQRGNINVQAMNVSAVSITMVFVCIAFIILSAPGMCARIWDSFIHYKTLSWNFFALILTMLLEVVGMLNYVVNFYIYSLSNPLFRKEMKRIIFRMDTQ